MSTNRIQKLLFSEYCDFEDMVLVESPFAETNREGTGLRQVHLGLTPSKLVLATDILPLAKDSSILYTPGLDPEIETLELVAVYPIDCVNLSVFHRRKRQSLKARFCNNRVLYFELGGFEKRNMFWNLWCEKIKFLSPEDPNFSHSETSVATSTSNSTLYLISSKRYINAGSSQIWCQYATGDFSRNDPPKWPDKHLYMGKILDESPLKYTPLQMPPTEEEFVKKKYVSRGLTRKKSMHLFPASVNASGDTLPLPEASGVSSGVVNQCSTDIFLPLVDADHQQVLYTRNTTTEGQSWSTNNNADLDTSSKQTIDVQCLRMFIHDQPFSFLEVVNSAVRTWEMQKATQSTLSIRGRHRRRYAFAPQPHFYRGLGPWNVNQGERFTLQMKRAVSAVSVKRQPAEPELRLSVARRQLVASISCENLATAAAAVAGSSGKDTHGNAMRHPHRSPVIFFWTPEYWYRPQNAREAYQELQAHLNKIQEYHHIKETFRQKIFRRKHKTPRSARHTASGSTVSTDTEGGGDEGSISNEYFKRVHKDRKHSIMHRFKPVTRRMGKGAQGSGVAGGGGGRDLTKETSLQFLKRVLRMDIALSAWDFDSNILATQLTLIDRELFLKILPEELSVLLWQQSSKNAPNIGALIAFSHRVSCLVATEVLKDDTEKIRARLITRFINVAEKCNSMKNFQSCRSVLCGLQSPPIYRLYSTWNYVRRRHSSRYEVFEELCRLYRDPRMPTFQSSFMNAAKANAYLPFIGDIISKLLDIVPTTTQNAASGSALDLKVSVKANKEESLTSTSGEEHQQQQPPDQTPSLFRKIISSLRVWHAENKDKGGGSSSSKRDSTDTFMVNMSSRRSRHYADYKSVADRYKQLYFYEDNRQARLKECVSALEAHQQAAVAYNFVPNELAREYLLKARYREDQENFIHSFLIEEPLHFDKS